MREIRKCVICGSSFVAYKYNAKYCSDKCAEVGTHRLNMEKKAKREKAAAERKARESSQKPPINITPEMQKTTPELCRKCVHSLTHGSLTEVICNYYEDTGNRRGCPVGYCDKFKSGQRKEIKTKVKGRRVGII